MADSLNDLGSVLLDQGKLAETEKLFRQALAMRRNVLTNGHPDIATSLNNLGAVLYTEGNFEEAERMQRERLWNCAKNSTATRRRTQRLRCTTLGMYCTLKTRIARPKRCFA